MPAWNQFSYCCKPRGKRKWLCWRAFIPVAQFQRNYLCRFPYFPETQRTTTKTKYSLQRNMNRRIRRKVTKELVAGCTLCVCCKQNWVIFFFLGSFLLSLKWHVNFSEYKGHSEMICTGTAVLAHNKLWDRVKCHQIVHFQYKIPPPIASSYAYFWKTDASLLSLMVKAHRQKLQIGRGLSWGVGPHGFCVKKVLNCQILIVCHLQFVEKKHLHAALCSAGYRASTMARKLHKQLSMSGIATLLKNSSLKPFRSSQGDGSDI